MTCELDHLVVVAADLAQGAAWCQATLGVTPSMGGHHALMATHNRLTTIASPTFPKAYLEIIAVDPDAAPPGRARWFGIDQPALRAAVRQQPRLVHAVLRATDIAAMRQGLIDLGLDPGAALAAERDTPLGRLAWTILVRDDGAIECDGALPTLIQWQGRHPSEAMAPSPLALTAVALGGVSAPVAGLLRPRGVTLSHRGPAVTATLATPLGAVTLSTL